MKTLNAPTEALIEEERSELTESVDSGTAVVLPVLNDDGFVEGAAVCVGRIGSEGAEIVRITVGMSGITADLAMSHKAGEPVTVLAYDSRRFYGSSTETGTYVLLATVAVKVDDPQGTMFEYLGATYLWFKATYYDSVSGDETDMADSEAVEGDQSARYTTVAKIRKRAGMQNNNYLQDDRFSDARTRAESEVNASIGVRYALPMTDVPGLVSEITEMLAAGMVMIDEYGDGEGSQGRKLANEARSMLEEMRNGTMAIVGNDGVELPRLSTSAPSFYPNATSASDLDNPTAAKMPRNKDY